MNYYESAEGQDITYARACRELRRHGIDKDDLDFVVEFPRDSFPRPAQAILDWLGY